MSFSSKDISATDPDWSREKLRKAWDPSRQLLRCLRRYVGIGENGKQLGKPGPFLRRWLVIRHRFWSAICGCEIHLGTQIGGGLILPHPVGIVIHPRATIGPNCIIFQNVTLGTNNSANPPQLGGHVDVGPGAVIIGDLVIGDHAVIGANAVVLHDVSARSVVGGVPARVLKQPAKGPTA
ncbi:serine O-acetyltransferase [Loktanella sp. DJP18]|uniref:serine O-acetyltransferase n=1 Tax=Loktanella sp. DJP18 TaxID=3409788 RepID=UPI003BB74FF5